jgi:hypothetical protein
VNGSATLDQEVLRYALGWETAFGFRALIALAGLLIVAAVVRNVRRRSTGLIVSLLWLAAGAGLLSFAAVPQRIIEMIVRTEYIARIQVISSVLSAIVLLITFESIRRNRLQERYALLWVATALVILLAAAFPRAVALFRAVTGMQYATAIVSVAFTFLVLVSFHFSIALSASQTRQQRIAQRLAILEAAVRDLQAAKSKAGPDGESAPKD